MSTRDCTPQRLDRAEQRETQNRSDLPTIDRVNLLKDGATINRFIGSCAERFLPSVTFDQRNGNNFIRFDADPRNACDPRLDTRLRQDRFDPRYGADHRGVDPRLGADPRLTDSRLCPDPRMIDQRMDPRLAAQRMDPRLADPRLGVDPRMIDQRLDPRLADPRLGADPRMIDQRMDPRLADPRFGADPRMIDQRMDPRLADPRFGADPRMIDQRMDPRMVNDPRCLDPRMRPDQRFNDGRDMQPANQARDYTVQSGDSLWKIAKNALRESGSPASARDIMQAIRQIVEANKAEHPSLASNPNLIMTGWHLKIPIGGRDSAGSDRGDLYQYGGDRRGGRTRYDGGDVYFDQRRRNPYGRDQDGRDPYGRNQYPSDRSPYGDRPDYQYGKDLMNNPISDLSRALKDAALNAARSMGTIGKCAAGVQRALARIGHSQWLGSGNAWDMGNKMARSGDFDVIPMTHAREGDIIVRSWNQNVINSRGGKNWGDIVVVTSRDGRGNLMGANDHYGRISPDGGRYTKSFALRYRA